LGFIKKCVVFWLALGSGKNCAHLEKNMKACPVSFMLQLEFVFQRIKDDFDKAAVCATNAHYGLREDQRPF